jgi:mannose-6-phosphate isomerase-like protein (cupin superfamily)
MRQKIKKTAMYLFIALGAYLVIGNLLHRVIFPEKKPNVSSHFQPGQTFYSKAEGFRQFVVRQENGFVHCELEIEPFAPGPPKHIHDGFDETFEIANGELSVWVDGVVKKVHPGEVLFIPKGTPHQPFNETADTIRTKGSFAFPEKFAYHLPQVYGYMDSHPDFGKSPRTIFQMSMFQGAGFDSYVVEGPPMFVQKMLQVVVGPAARLAGFRSYYSEYDIRNVNTAMPAAKL